MTINNTNLKLDTENMSSKSNNHVKNKDFSQQVNNDNFENQDIKKLKNPRDESDEVEIKIPCFKLKKESQVLKLNTNDEVDKLNNIMKIRDNIRNLQNPSKYTVTTDNDDKGTSTSINEAENP